jgi:hypothetical protein
MEKIIYHGPNAKNIFDAKVGKCFLSYPILKITEDISVDEVKDFSSNFLVPSFTKNSWIGLGPLDLLKPSYFDVLLKSLEESVHNVVSWCSSISSVSETIISRMRPIWCYDPSVSPAKRLDDSLIENISRRNIYELITIFGEDITSDQILKEVSLEIIKSNRSEFILELWSKLRSIDNYDFFSEGLKKKLLLTTILTHFK